MTTKGRSGEASRIPRFVLPALIALAVVGSATGVGGALPWVVMATTALAAVITAVASVEDVETRPHGLSPVVVLWVLSGFSLAQAIPMPIAWLSAIAPASADVWARALSPLGEQVHFGSISLEPGASILEAAKWATYAGVLHGASVMARREGSELGLGILFGSALFVALVTIGHGLLGVTSLFGVYEPRHLHWEYVGPFLNPNNLAGYLVLGTLAGIGLILSRRPVLPAAALAAGVVVLVALTVRSASRGGVLALLVGLGALVSFLVVSRMLARKSGKDSSRKKGIGTVGLAAALGVGVAVMGANETVRRDLLNQSTAKLELATWCVPVIRDYPWFGIGRGAFESVFPAYNHVTVYNSILTHPENLPAQWAVEWGLPVSGAALAFFLWRFRPWKVGVLRSATQASAFCGLLAITAQNFVDLSLELAGVGVAFAVALGCLWGDARKLGMRVSSASRGRRRAIVRVGTAWIALTCVVAVVGPTRPVSTERELARKSLDALDGGDDGAERVRTVLRDAMLRHPADYYFPLVGATVAHTHRENPIPWLQRALERGPAVGRTHLVLAEVLASRAASRQALLEIRLAVTSDPTLMKAGVGLAFRITQNPAELELASPEGIAGAEMLSRMSALLPVGSGQDALDIAALERDPTILAARERQIARLFAAMSAEAPECARAPGQLRNRCAERIEAHADALESSMPQSSKAAQVRARLAVVAGDRSAARELLQVACRLPRDVTPCLEQLAHVTDGPAVDAVLQRYAAMSCATKPGCAQAWTWIAALRAGRNEGAQAVGAARRAAAVDPTGARWLLVADYAERLGFPTEATNALEQALSVGGVDEAETRRRLSALQRR